MKLKCLILIAILPVSTTVFAKKELPANRYSCQKVEYKIDTVKERQRKGYSSKQGEKLRYDLRLLKDLKKNCKKKKLPTK
jgi:hypothetical protein